MIYEFGEYRLDEKRRVLQSRPDGQPLQVTGRVFDTLLYFVERPGQLLDKRLMLNALWPSVVVEEANLTQTIYTLRRVLGESPSDHRYIVTVPGRGYRFVADVNAVPVNEPADEPQIAEAPATSLPRRSRSQNLAPYALAVLLLATVAVLIHATLRSQAESAATPAQSGAPSIAVLAFADMSAQKDQEHFADGLSEEILNLLAQSPALRVIARTSSFAFKHQRADIATIASRLNVTHVLEGSVRKSGERIRITAQLVDGATSEHLWSQTYDRDARDVFDVQTDIAAAVAKALQVTLKVGTSATPGDTTNAQAYESYLHGRHFLNRRGTSDVARAREHFEQAVRLDPGYARAWAGLAGTLFMTEDANRSVPADLMQQWRHAVERALAHGPNLVDAHMRAYQYYALTGNAAAADEHFRRAAALNPSDPWVLAKLGPSLAEGGLSEVIALHRRMVALDPLSAVSRGNLAVFLMAAGEWEEAKIEYGKALELSPASPVLRRDIAKILVLQGRPGEALAVAGQLPEGPLRDQCLALAYQASGQTEASDAALARLIGVGEQAGTDAEFKVNIAEIYAYRGNSEEAFKWLARMSAQTRDADAIEPYWWSRQELPLSPFLQSLQADARWRTLLADGLKSS